MKSHVKSHVKSHIKSHVENRVAIIGAGVAGLRAGGLLQAQGLAVQLFDKARAPAGRIATRRLDFGRFDHGAQYFTARDPRFASQVTDWLERGVVARWDARIVSLSGGAIQSEATPAIRYVGTPSMSGIARDLARGLSVETGVRIASVRRAGEKWTLVTDDGLEKAGFDLLICAVPAPQALPFLTASDAFTLQARRAQLKPCHALMIRFARPLELDFDAAFVKDSILAWVAQEASKPGRDPSNAWLLHSTAAWSQANLELQADRVLEHLCGAFEAALGRSLPGLDGASVHRWLFARASSPVLAAESFDESLGLGVCGDWLRGDRIEDAFLSAEVLAGAIGAPRDDLAAI